MFGFFGRNTDASPPPTFKVFCKADEGRCLAVRDGTIALAAADPGDECQHWTKDVRLSRIIKDKEGQPVFSLVNKATGLALQHSLAPGDPVRLARFYPDGYDESILWTESVDLRKAFGCIRMMHNVDLTLHALRDGSTVVLADIKSNGCSKGHSWKTVPWADEVFVDELDFQPTSRIYCKDDEKYSITIRDGVICLARTDPKDMYQHWIQDKRPGDFFRDHDGYPAFVLVNKVTGEAMSGEAGEGCHLKLKPYNPNFLDVSVLWTMSKDMGHGFRYIHMVADIALNFEAIQGGKDLGGVENLSLNLDDLQVSKDHGEQSTGTSIVLSCKFKGDGLQWNIIPWS